MVDRKKNLASVLAALLFAAAAPAVFATAQRKVLAPV
jgi:hypothetical protein